MFIKPTWSFNLKVRTKFIKRVGIVRRQKFEWAGGSVVDFLVSCMLCGPWEGPYVYQYQSLVKHVLNRASRKRHPVRLWENELSYRKESLQTGRCMHGMHTLAATGNSMFALFIFDHVHNPWDSVLTHYLQCFSIPRPSVAKPFLWRHRSPGQTLFLTQRIVGRVEINLVPREFPLVIWENPWERVCVEMKRPRN